MKAEDEELYGVINTNGRMFIPAIYRNIYSPLDNYEQLIVTTDIDANYIGGIKTGVLDLSGKVIIPFKYDDIELTFQKQRFLVRADGKTGIYDFQGKEIIPSIYRNITYPDYIENNKLCVVITNSKCGVFDINGRQIIPCKYNSIQIMENGSFYVK